MSTQLLLEAFTDGTATAVLAPLPTLINTTHSN